MKEIRQEWFGNIKGDLLAGIVVCMALIHNLAYGVILGIILSALFFASKISEIKVKKIKEDTKTTYIANGQLFFASTLKFVDRMAVHNKPGVLEEASGH